MDTKQNQDGRAKKKAVVHITIFVVVISVIVIAILLATSTFDFTNFVIKLHGG